ncbi:MAG: hypothetical protein GY941_01435 [Planctomycetes bacterium]|nr:hypothetical protein [Planctomycetota bacterium]
MRNSILRLFDLRSKGMLPDVFRYYFKNHYTIILFNNNENIQRLIRDVFHFLAYSLLISWLLGKRCGSIE